MARHLDVEMPPFRAWFAAEEATLVCPSRSRLGRADEVKGDEGALCSLNYLVGDERPSGPLPVFGCPLRPVFPRQRVTGSNRD